MATWDYTSFSYDVSISSSYFSIYFEIVSTKCSYITMYGNVFVVVPATFSTYPINLEVCPCQVTVTRRHGHMMTSLNGILKQTKRFDALVFATHLRFSGWFRRKLHALHLHAAKLKKKLSQRILWGAVFSSVPVHRDRDSQFQTFPLPLHVRPTFLIGNWFVNLSFMMCGKVNTIVVKLVDSTARDIRPGTPKDMILVSLNSETPRLSVGA